MGTNVSNNVNTTERTYKPQASQSGQKTSAQNSIYDAKQPQTHDNGSTENKNISTEIDKILEKICEKFKKYGLTVEDLKKNPLIQKVCNLTDEQLAKIPDKEKAVKMYVECLETAIRDSIVDGKIDLNQVSKLSNDYFIAVSTGWTIEGFKKHNSTHEKHSLIDRLIASGCLPKDATLENTPEPQIKRAIRRYFRQIIKYAESNPSEKDIKLQLQTFGRLLINSSELEKALFLEVVQTLYQRNRLKGLEALFASCKTDKTRQAVAAEAGSPEYIKELTTTPDADGQVMSEDDVTAASALIAENQSEEDRTQAHEDYDNARAEWFEKNKDALEALDQKLKKAEAEGVEPELTDAEKQLLIERQNFIKAVSAGEFIGVQENKFLSDEFKELHLSDLNKDAYEVPDYKDILNQINEYIEKNPNALTTTSKEQFTKTMDKATNGNYSTVASGSDAELKAPVQTNTEKEDTTPDLGFATRENVDTSRLTALRQQIMTTDNKQSFKVEKNNTTNPIKTANTLNEKMSEAANNQDRLAIIKEFFEKSPMLKKALEKYVIGATDSLTILNALPTNARKYLAQKLTQKGLLKEEDIEKLKLSINEKQLLITMYRKIQKPEEV